MKTTNYRKPSIQSLTAGLNISREQAIAARALMAGDTRITGNPAFPVTNEWISACYSKPRRIDLILSALNELLEFHGVLPIWSRKDLWCPIAENLNSGDTYAATILFRHDTETFRVTTFGDFIETNEKRLSLR